MYKITFGIATTLLCMTGLALAEPQTTRPTTPANPQVNVQLNTEFLNDLMRSAAMLSSTSRNPVSTV